MGSGMKFALARPTVDSSPQSSLNDGKLLNPVEAVLIERKRLQLYTVQSDLDFPAVHLTTEA
jgi:hypothetical protein